MKCLDDCHTYELETVMGHGQYCGHCGGDLLPSTIKFYEMRPDGTKIDGVTNEEVLRVLIHRLNKLNSGAFRCRENSVAITKLEEALMWLNKRTEDRVARKVEGTHQV